ncbi:MAG: hypothetical protein NTW74_15860 [Acidobacteria bacterium]|nr:hypothetical protein [Acidobacteriota bacterium]
MKAIYSLGFVASLALGQQEPVPAVGQTRMVFFANANVDESKGAAYSADSTTETTQVLQDGNRIKNTNRSKFARDSEGRTRRESTVQMLGPLGRTEEPIVSVFINDPVAKVQYTLDSRAKVAMKSKGAGSMTFRTKPDQAARIREEIVMERKVVEGNARNVIIEHKIIGPAKSVDSAQITQSIDVRGPGDMKSEDLGNRMIEGVNAKGTRITMTIPAGEVGNERPIEVVTENWFSEELNAMVLTRHNDPRMGETVTRLENIKLGAPPKSLFEPPVDYKVEEVANMRMPMPAMPAIRVREDR